MLYGPDDGRLGLVVAIHGEVKWPGGNPVQRSFEGGPRHVTLELLGTA